jgi:hypothetical protein
VEIIDAAVWGTTVESAATARIVSVASPGAPLADITRVSPKSGHPSSRR